jgi:hypothetical protein
MPGRFLFRFGTPGCCCADELLSGAEDCWTAPLPPPVAAAEETVAPSPEAAEVTLDWVMVGVVLSEFSNFTTRFQLALEPEPGPPTACDDAAAAGNPPFNITEKTKSECTLNKNSTQQIPLPSHPADRIQ